MINGGNASGWFSLETGVRQGCVMSECFHCYHYLEHDKYHNNIVGEAENAARDRTKWRKLLRVYAPTNMKLLRGLMHQLG